MLTTQYRPTQSTRADNAHARRCYARVNVRQSAMVKSKSNRLHPGQNIIVTNFLVAVLFLTVFSTKKQHGIFHATNAIIKIS